MDPVTIAVFAAAAVLFALISGRLEGTVLTAPLAFAGFGIAAGSLGFDFAHLDLEHSVIHLLAEATLVLVLFTDAARIDLAVARRFHNLPFRMLTVGLPLAMFAGFAVALWLLPELSLWEAALLAALLAPTDAALGQAVVSARAVPARIRQAINIESGLNDGIALPAVLFFAAIASGHRGDSAGTWLQFAGLQLLFGPLVGIALGWLGARLLDLAARSGWASEAFQGIGVLSLALLTYLVAELVGGNGFIAAFVGGLVFGNTLTAPCKFLFEFMETEGQLLMMVTFLVFGAVLLPEGLAALQPIHFLYALLSLTVIRMVPIALSMLGTGLCLRTQLFLGWFGPRGLASILFVLLIVEDMALPHREEILAITMITVAMSILLHGMTAAPFARLYGRHTDELGQCPENVPVEELPLRNGPAGV